MRLHRLLPLLLLFMTSVAFAAPPNVVLLISDDQAWNDYGFMGHDAIASPNLDKLARESVVFRRGYVPTALCRPSLMTLATGHYAHRHGVAPIKEFVKESVAAEKPFFLWYAPFLPHTPHNPPPRLLKKYQSADRPLTVAKYYAMCEWFDETCGELLGTPIDRDTIFGEGFAHDIADIDNPEASLLYRWCIEI